MFGFRASLNFLSGKKSNKDRDDIGSVVSITGAYRSSKDEFFAYNKPDGQRKSTPHTHYNFPATSTGQPTTPLRQTRSTSDLVKNKNLPPNLRPENPGVSQDPRGAGLDTRNNKPQENPKPQERKLDAQVRVEKQRIEAQKKLEKQQIEEHKKLEKQRQADQKLALKEQARQEKLRKEREKKEAQLAKKKKQAPLRPAANPPAQATASTSNPLAQGSGQVPYSTNTLDSSISKTSGPPPYSNSKPDGEKDSSGNVIYTKPVDTGSWAMVSKHRQNISRPATVGTTQQTKQTVMDLNYKVDEGNKENSEA